MHLTNVRREYTAFVIMTENYAYSVILGQKSIFFCHVINVLLQFFNKDEEIYFKNVTKLIMKTILDH